jgi:uncharacterized protein with HEPN domain
VTETRGKTLYAGVRVLEIVGEAAQQVPKEVHEVPWAEMAARELGRLHLRDAA